jgi:hypothetical protein
VNEPNRQHASDGFDADAIFADIVAHMDDDAVEPGRMGTPFDDGTADGGQADRGAAPDVTGHDVSAEASAADQPPGERWLPVNQPPVLPPPVRPEAVPTPQVWRAQELDDEYEEHFEPPPVAPLPVGDLQFWGIIAGMGGGPLLLLYLMLFNREAGSYWILTSIAMSVGGFALLVSRLPAQQEDDDDGARL